MKKEYAKYLLEKLKQDYNQIANEFSSTRNFFWDIEPLKRYIKPRDKILDVGCGNGRLQEILKEKNVDYIGVDISEKLIEIAKRKYPRAKFIVLTDPLKLPFEDNSFDKVFAIRVLHHIPSEDFRKKFLKELKRVLKPSGLLILTVWSWKSRDKRSFFRILKSIFLKIIKKSELDFGDVFVPWKNRIQRYYHFFSKRGLKKLMKECGFQIKNIYDSLEEKKYFDIYVIARKP